jgi:glycosyltransferase involved in cell wall biosynthesis
LLYVSAISPYKHQTEVMEAVHQLRQEGFPLELELVGPRSGYARAFDKVRAGLDPTSDWIHWHGPVSFEALHLTYHNADAFVFASSCENLPNILLEAMAAGLPIASSNRGPMPEIMGDGGISFDPDDVTTLTNALRVLVRDHRLREYVSQVAHARAKTFSWEECAARTLEFVSLYGKSI